MAYLLGLRDILRPIRDRYRHLFPAPDAGPTPEERQKQRAIDRLKGFTYFDTFEQLETWTEADVDTLQQANTPLLVRSVRERDGLGKANVLLCHDYAGNYHSYEGVSNIGLGEERYACEYMQYVETFIYFSHKLVCVPPPTWTNTLHRNGVQALGTILIESQTLGSEKLLQYGEDVHSFPLAKKLAEIAHSYGFDGWLVNIEKSFPTTSWNAIVLEDFLRQLRSDLGSEKQLIWYDALTISNKVSYQNALNASNLPFAKACGGILTNYCWKESDAANSIHEALQEGLSLQQVCFGIDVWAQNTTKLSHPRITYPEYGGGGTNTGVAVAKLAELEFSAGIFAPAWAFEHFPGHGRNVEQTMWEGKKLPESTNCSCGDCRKRHQPNKSMPVISTARRYNAGSETFFFTDFCRAFSTHGNEEKEILFDGFETHAQLGSQSILPVTENALVIPHPLQHRLENVSGRAQLVLETHSTCSSSTKEAKFLDCCWTLPLFRLDMPANGSLRLRMSFRDLTDGKVAFYMRVSGTEHLLMPCKTRSAYTLDTIIKVTPSVPDPRLEELGVRVTTLGTESALRLAEVDFICIQDVASEVLSRTHKIYNVHTSSRGEGETQHLRLCWSYTSSSQSINGMPFSHITGPFSYFTIVVDYLTLGRSYALECMLPGPFVERIAGREATVRITGIGFDGQELASVSTMLQF